MNFFQILMYFLVIHNIYSQTVFQAVWFIETTCEISPCTYLNQYHKLKMKFFSDQISLDSYVPTDDYLLLIKRNNSGSVAYTNGPKSAPVQNNRRLKYFIPNLDLSHKDSLSYVMYDIIVNSCGGCNIEYSIKYFTCDSSAQTFFDSITTSKYFRKTSSLEVIVYGDSSSQFTSNINLKNTLLGTVYCNSSGIDESCCVPHSCLVDFSSINCICNLETEGGLGTDFCDNSLVLYK